MHRLGLMLLTFIVLTGCERRASLPDAGDPGGDGGPLLDAGPMVGDDAGPLPRDGSEPTPPAEVVRAGSGGFLLRGTVLAPDAVIERGEVLVVGDTIACVATDCSGRSEAADVTIIETHGVISPGLIDSHNHIAYNFLAEWEPGMLFDNRDQWRSNAGYRDWVAPQNELTAPGGTWGELRSIIHGTTTIQGQSVVRTAHDRLARNADHYHGLATGPGEAGRGNLRTQIASPADVTTSTAEGLAASFSRPDGPARRMAIHMCEGLRGSNMEIEFESWAGRDPRGLDRHQGLNLLAYEGAFMGSEYSYSGVSVLIHSLILTEEQILETIDTGSYVVWSPSSNMALYGETAPIALMLELGVTLGLGPDWTPSGEDDMLSEMRFAYEYGLREGIELLDPARLWQMATYDGAEVVGLEQWIGRLEEGMRADIAVFGRRSEDPYRAVLDSRAEDVRLVLIDGLGYYGDVALEGDTAINGDCDVIDACGTMKYLCLKNVPRSNGMPSTHADETVEDVRAQLEEVLAPLGRLGDLQELIVCE